MTKKIIIIVVLAIIIASVGVMLLDHDTNNDDNASEEAVVIKERYKHSGKLYVGGLFLAMSDENLSEAEVILRENLPTSFTAEKVDWIGPRYYTVIPSSEFNSLKETLWENESIEITAVKQENGDLYAFFGACFGKIDLDFDITELQEHLDEYSLEAKEVNWIYVQLGDNVRYSEIKETLDLLENESNVIRVSPDVLER